MFFNEIWYDYPRFSVETNMIRFMNLVEIVGRVHPLFFMFCVPEIFRTSPQQLVFATLRFLDDTNRG